MCLEFSCHHIQLLYYIWIRNCYIYFGPEEIKYLLKFSHWTRGKIGFIFKTLHDLSSTVYFEYFESKENEYFIIKWKFHATSSYLSFKLPWNAQKTLFDKKKYISNAIIETSSDFWPENEGNKEHPMKFCRLVSELIYSQVIKSTTKTVCVCTHSHC